MQVERSREKVFSKVYIMRKQKEEELRNKWIRAKENSFASSVVEEEDKKNYYEFAKGGLWYQNMLEKKAAKKTVDGSDDFKIRFTEKKKEIIELLKIYEEKKRQKLEIEDMSKTIKADIAEIAKKVNFGINTKNINNRMFNWYEEQNDSLQTWKRRCSILYWIVLVVMTFLVIKKFGLQNKKALLIIIVFGIVPIFLNIIFQWILGVRANNCPTYIPSLGFESGGSKTCQVKKAEKAVDCVMSDWDKCSKECGGGIQKRKIEMKAMYGGKPCTVTSRSCNTQKCPKSVDLSKSVSKSVDSKNVIIEMTKDLWQSFRSRLPGAKEKK